MKDFIKKYNDEIIEEISIDDDEEYFVFFDYAWDIKGIIEFVEKHHDEILFNHSNPKMFSEIISFIEIDIEYAKTTDIDKPGIVVEFKPGEYMLIDGWHRTWKAINNNQFMNYYILNYEQQKQFMIK